jgi:hypothetical protein
MAGLKYGECIGSSYHLDDPKAASSTAVNCYPQKLDGDRWMMASAPGMDALYTLGLGTWRGSKSLDDRWFAVKGSTLYEIGPAGEFTARGALASNSGYVGIAINQSQVAIVDGPNLYIYNYSAQAFTTITSPGWLGSNDVHEIDGYFVFVDPDTDVFYISEIDDGTDLDALDFSTADSSPDAIITHRVNHRQLWLFGKSNSTEIWINTGNPAFPFERYQAYTLDVGCVGERAAVNAADTLFFVGKTDRGTGIVYMVQGNRPVRVSNSAVEQAIRDSTDATQISMWSYQVEGHEFVGLEIPGYEKTWVYDAALGEWHERGYWAREGFGDGWSPLGLRFVTYFATTLGGAFEGTHWAGDMNGVAMFGLNRDSNLLRLDRMVRERTWPHIVKDSLEPTCFRGLELSMKTGVPVVSPSPGESGPGVVTLEISNDGGASFGPPLPRQLGVTGRRMERVRWLNLGTTINRVFRIRCSSDVPFAIYSAAVDT